MPSRIRFVIALVAVAASGCGYPDFEFVPPANDATSPEADTNDASVADDAADTTVANDTGIDATDTTDASDTRDAAPILRTWLFDFGAGATPTPGYNNVTETLTPGGTLAKLIDSTGVMTTASLRLDSTDRFHHANPDGNLTPPVSLGFPATATRDSLFGSTADFMGVARPRALMELLGLDPALGYDLEIYASRIMGVGVLETAYTVRGVAAPITLTLNANNNAGTTVKFSRVRPSSTGWISLSVTAGPGNTNSFGFYYIGAMRVTAVVP